MSDATIDPTEQSRVNERFFAALARPTAAPSETDPPIGDAPNNRPPSRRAEGPEDQDDVAPSWEPTPSAIEVDRFFEMGCKAVCIVPGAKRPEGTRWQEGHARERVLEHVRRGGSFGVIPGPELAVLDLDPRNGGGESITQLEAETDIDLSDYPTVRTGGGGFHILMRVPSGNYYKNLMAYPGIDFITGEGKQFVGPSSIHPSGRQYFWHTPWAGMLLFGEVGDGEPPAGATPIGGGLWELPPPTLGELIPAAPAPIVALFAKRPPREVLLRREEGGDEIPQGERNDGLISIAGGMRRQGLDEDAIYQRLTAANAERCDPPLPDAEVRQVARSAARYEPDGERGTDVANGRRFAQQHRDHLRQCEALGASVWFRWDGRRWAKCLSSVALDAARTTVQEMAVEAACDPDTNSRRQRLAWAKSSRSRNRLLAMVSLGAIDLQVDPRELDADWALLNVENGTIELKPDGFAPLREHRRRDMLTRVAGVPFEPTATCALWLETLERALPDPEVRAYFQRSVGYMLVGGQSGKAIFIYFGPPDGLKSTLVRALLRALGDYGAVTRLATFGLGADGSGNTPSLALLNGPRLVVVNEVPPVSKLSTGLVKAWSGGDTIEACQKHERPFAFAPAGKLVFVGNARPEIPYDDDGAWRRIHVMPFDNPVPKDEQIEGVAERIDPKAVLAWAVEGYRLYREAGGLNPPARAREAVEDYRIAQDPLAEFVTDKLELTPDAWTATAELHEAYTRWCRSRGIYKAMAKSPFASALVAGRPGVALAKHGKAKTNGVSGVKLQETKRGSESADDWL